MSDQPEIKSTATAGPGVRGLLARGLAKTRASIARTLGSNRETAKLQREQLEAALISADCGVQTTSYLLQETDAVLKTNPDSDTATALQHVMYRLLEPVAVEFVPGENLSVILLTGTNGSGKTTTAAKLCNYYSTAGYSLMLAAADTFRAAATEQLCLWAERCQVPVVSKQPGADPAAVCYEAVQQARQQKVDILIIDSAGRQHNDKPMLQELQKIRKVIDKAAPAATKIESWIVLDANTGQNCLSQVAGFTDSALLTGTVLTKLDSSARGGMILSLALKQKLPVRFIGVGEKLSDLHTLDAAAFASNLTSFDKVEA